MATFQEQQEGPCQSIFPMAKIFPTAQFKCRSFLGTCESYLPWGKVAVYTINFSHGGKKYIFFSFSRVFKQGKVSLKGDTSGLRELVASG